MTAIATDYREGRIDVGGLSLHYLDWGDEDAPPLVLLHGLTSHAHSWDALATALRSDRRVVALDQRGHGDSAWPVDGSYTTSDFVADARGLLDALALGRVVLAGLSMGAHNSIAFTAAHPDRVAKLVAVDIPPALRRTGSANSPPQPPPRDFESVDEAYAAARAQNPRPPEAVHRHRIEKGLRRREDGRYELKYDPSAPRNWRADDLWDALPSIACPVLVVRGAESPVLPQETAQKMVASFPKATLVSIEGSGHSVPLDRPDAFADAVRDFLAS